MELGPATAAYRERGATRWVSVSWKWTRTMSRYSTSCQRQCFNYTTDHDRSRPPSDCTGLVGIEAVPASTGRGAGYVFQVCPKLSEAGKPARRIRAFPATVPEVIVLNTHKMPAREALVEMAKALDEDSEAHQRLIFDPRSSSATPPAGGSPGASV